MLGVNVLRQANRLGIPNPTRICSILIQRNVMNAVKNEQEPDGLRSKWGNASFNVNKMMELLDHDNHEMRKDFRKFLSDPVFKPRYNIPLEEEREVININVKRYFTYI